MLLPVPFATLRMFNPERSLHVGQQGSPLRGPSLWYALGSWMKQHLEGVDAIFSLLKSHRQAMAQLVDVNLMPIGNPYNLSLQFQQGLDLWKRYVTRTMHATQHATLLMLSCYPACMLPSPRCLNATLTAHY